MRIFVFRFIILFILSSVFSNSFSFLYYFQNYNPSRMRKKFDVIDNVDLIAEEINMADKPDLDLYKKSDINTIIDFDFE